MRRSGGPTALAEYTYLGAAAVIKVAHPAVDDGLDLTHGSAGDGDGKFEDTGSPPADTLVARYYCDGMHRRIAKAVANGANWDRTDFYYNTSWQVVEERKTAAQGTATAPGTDLKYQYVWDIRYACLPGRRQPGRQVDAPVCRDENKNDDDDCTDADPTDEHLFYTNDDNFNVTALIDGSDGAVVERYVYDPYGKVTSFDDDWSDTRAASSYANEILYCGYRHDPESGLYHVRNRMYHPTLGRFITVDPIKDGMNWFEYAVGNPIVYLDSNGEAAERGDQLVGWTEYERQQEYKYWGWAEYERNRGNYETANRYMKYRQQAIDTRERYEKELQKGGGGTWLRDYYHLRITKQECCDAEIPEVAERPCKLRIWAKASRLAAPYVGTGVGGLVGGGLCIAGGAVMSTGVLTVPGAIIYGGGAAIGPYGVYETGKAMEINNTGRKAGELYCDCDNIIK